MLLSHDTEKNKDRYTVFFWFFFFFYRSDNRRKHMGVTFECFYNVSIELEGKHF